MLELLLPTIYMAIYIYVKKARYNKCALYFMWKEVRLVMILRSEGVHSRVSDMPPRKFHVLHWEGKKARSGESPGKPE